MSVQSGEAAKPVASAPAATHLHDHAHDHGCDGAHDRPAPRPHDPAALIGARGLEVARSGRVILSGVDLDIHAGEIVTLIGPTGAGKTTLVRTLLGLERPDGGTVRRRARLKIG
jgi:zinc transport system ATP-binding protein